MKTRYICRECGWIGIDAKETNGHGLRCPLCFGLCRKYELKHLIRKEAEEFLSNGKSRAKAASLAKHIRRKILERSVVSTGDLRQITPERVGASLAASAKFEQSCCEGAWRLA